MKGFFTALAFLTAVPVPLRLQSDLSGSFYYFPLVGLFLGAMMAGISLVLLPWVGAGVGAVIFLILYALLTGALHLDGVADCCDGFYGQRTKERVLEIMKDPRVGAMGVVGMVLVLLAKFSVLQSISFRTLAFLLPAGFMLSRTVPLVFMLTLPYAREEGILGGLQQRSKTGLIIVSGISLALCLAYAPIPSIVALLVLLVFLLQCRKKIGGYTGDCMGAGIEFTETAFLLAALIAERNGLSSGLIMKMAGFFS